MSTFEGFVFAVVASGFVAGFLLGLIAGRMSVR